MSESALPQGYLALILHAHLPYVRHPEHEDFLEEDWFYEAMTETYLPLLALLDRLRKDQVTFQFTISLTPTLCSMMRDPLLQERYEQHLEKLIEFCEKEIDRTRLDPKLHQLAWFYHRRLEQCRILFTEQYQKKIIPAFKEFQDQGYLEIITCAATHGYLPLMTDYPQAIRAQILIGRDDYRDCFGRNPRGIWLPECAYVPGIESFLAEAEIRWFIVDSHGVLFAEPRPAYGIYSPIVTSAGVLAFGRDMESSQQVWSAEVGYPGDPHYRDFYRDVGLDLDYDYVKPYIQPNGTRKSLGIKYHRITGRGVDKALYEPDEAREKAAEHAHDFMMNRVKQIEHLFRTMGTRPVVLSPYDAELFGHWWYEGPEFLEFLIRKVAYDQKTFQMISPSHYLENHPTQPLATPAASSWGSKGYSEVWLEGSNAWIYPHLHAATERMIEIAQKNREAKGVMDRALAQAARELLLAQSSDWAFIMKTGTMVAYAEKRTKDHLLRFQRLYEQINKREVEEEFLAYCEWKSPLFPQIEWRYYI